MHMREIVQINEVFHSAPVYFEDRFDFASVTYLKPDSSQIRGLHLPDCDSVEAMVACKNKAPYGYDRIQRVIEEIIEFNDITFSIFSILHELGHWVQYADYINQGHNDMEFVLEYEGDRAALHRLRKVEYQKCKSEDDVSMLNKRFEELYSELLTEQYANQYAKQLLPQTYYSTTKPRA